MAQTINSQTFLRGDPYTEVVDITLNGTGGVGTWTSKLAKPKAAVVTKIGDATPTAETFAVNISGRIITVYSSSDTSTSRVFVIVQGYQW
jgi:hypothetical protein